MFEGMYRAEKRQRQNLEKKIIWLADCNNCPRVKRFFCITPCPAVKLVQEAQR